MNEALRVEQLVVPLPRKRKILICIPCHSGVPDYGTVVSCANAASEAEQHGWETALMVRSTDSILIRARDVLFSQFYASDCEDMLFVDSDIAWNPGVFAKLMNHTHDKDGNPVEIVAGVYPSRGDPMDFVVRTLGRSINVQYPSGLAEVAGAATGFMRITRAAATKLVDAFGDDWYEDHTAPGLRIYHMFDFVYRRENRVLFSEDYIFCEKFREIGGRVFVDVDLTLHHSGRKTWTGNFDQHLRGGGDERNRVVAEAPVGNVVPIPVPQVRHDSSVADLARMFTGANL